jgi:hypothetical protein
MRLAEGVHIQWIGDEAVALNEETGYLHYLNSTAAVILALVLEYGSEEAAARLSATYEDEHALEHDMTAVLDDLRDKELLVEDA